MGNILRLLTEVVKYVVTVKSWYFVFLTIHMLVEVVKVEKKIFLTIIDSEDACKIVLSWMLLLAYM